MSLEPRKIWCLLWNPSQGYFHRDTLDRYLERNQRLFLDDKPVKAWETLLEIAESEEELSAKSESWKDIRPDPPPYIKA